MVRQHSEVGTVDWKVRGPGRRVSCWEAAVGKWSCRATCERLVTVGFLYMNMCQTLWRYCYSKSRLSVCRYKLRAKIEFSPLTP